ncbi:hypothetical protein G6F35_017100 [Rhizopus arrhizus]|nr:hypothetical protein G6F35_017100 [Rhizopus arrhizus]
MPGRPKQGEASIAAWQRRVFQLAATRSAPCRAATPDPSCLRYPAMLRPSLTLLRRAPSPKTRNRRSASARSTATRPSPPSWGPTRRAGSWRLSRSTPKAACWAGNWKSSPATTTATPVIPCVLPRNCWRARRSSCCSAASCPTPGWP